MKLKQAISLTTDDSARPELAQQAYNLIGADHLAETDRKAFGRIRGNDFTLDDVDAAVLAVKRRRDDLHEKANAPEGFKDIKAAERWTSALRANSDQAVSDIEHFRRSVINDLAAALNTQTPRASGCP